MLGKWRKCVICGKEYPEDTFTTIVSPLQFKIGECAVILKRGAALCQICKDKYVKGGAL